MAFAPTPPRNNAPSQLLSLGSILASTGASVTSEGGGDVVSLTLTSPPASGSAGAALLIAGAVSPSGTAVRVGLSSSSATAPSAWTSATVTGTAWTASLTPGSAGTWYIWAEQTATPAVKAVSPMVTVAAGSAIAFSTVPSSGTAGTALTVAGTVSPSGSAARVSLSTSATAAPTSWTTASVSGSSWSASLTASGAGTYYAWAQQTNATSIQAVSAAITIGAAGGAALTYSLISGSGNGSLTGLSVVTATSSNYSPSPATDWTSSIAAGSTDVAPSIVLSQDHVVSSAKFWFDTSATSTTVPATYGNNASDSNGAITFYAFATGYGTPVTVPAAPSSAGTYYGKYAMYDSSSTLLGVFVTSAITVH